MSVSVYVLNVCEGLIEQGSCNRGPRSNGVEEADRGFSRMPRGNDNILDMMYFNALIQ